MNTSISILLVVVIIATILAIILIIKNKRRDNEAKIFSRDMQEIMKLMDSGLTKKQAETMHYKWCKDRGIKTWKDLKNK